MARSVFAHRSIIYISAAVCAFVAIPIAVFMYSTSGSGSDVAPPPCPPVQEATGVQKPQKVDPKQDQGKLEVVDEGLKPYGGSLEQGVSFGVVVENTTDLVLYDGVVSVSFVGSDGEDPTEVFIKDIYHGEERDALNEVPVPMVMPGQEYGFGSTLQVASDHIFLTEDKIVEMDEIDYEDLTVEVSLVSGEWWKPKNDVRSFEEADVVNVGKDDGAEELRDTYFDGSEMVDHRFTYELDYDGCVKHPRYTSSAVLYGSGGEIVGGKTSIWPMSVEHFGYERDLGHAPGPEDVVEARVFPAFKAVEPNLEQ